MDKPVHLIIIWAIIVYKIIHWAVRISGMYQVAQLLNIPSIHMVGSLLYTEKEKVIAENE